MQYIGKSRVAHCDLIRFLTLSLVLGTWACAPAPPARSPAGSSAGAGGVEVTTDRSRYGPGDPLTLTVHNGGADTLAFNPCTRTIERESDGGWSPVSEPQRICTMEAWILAPGERRAGPTELPAELPPGRYRAALAFTVEGAHGSGSRVEARSAPFSVER
jgi:hypothetical protein